MANAKFYGGGNMGQGYCWVGFLGLGNQMAACNSKSQEVDTTQKSIRLQTIVNFHNS